MNRNLSLTLFATGMLLIWTAFTAFTTFDASTGSLLQPFSAQMTTQVVLALVTGIFITVTGLAGLRPKCER